ncbi:Uncharacterised protein [Sphingobacterium spiritivorum]|uniref:DUF3037 domain-containing protein n=1 Tax=Sphingobacterium spiritivorum TaxID=258 RepID=A0A380CTF5_SPHSI|nr:DUF3037 domain-containing protein [Sphingobacterium spiritivorum]SUJ28689.1 Uncharacterised protein [Sphingobacterium spiritivorum]
MKININVLRYKHSQVLGELVNVGVLIFYVSDKRFNFLTLKTFERLESLYDNFTDSIIQQQMDFVKKKIESLDFLNPYDDKGKLDVLSFIENKVLPKDASHLQFGEDIVVFYPKEYFDVNIFEDNVTKSYLLATPDVIFKSELKAKRSDIQTSLNLWIAPDYKNRIAKIEKDFIYLPRKRKL